MTEITVSGKGLPAAETAELVKATLASEQASVARIEVSFVGPEVIRRLNREHRGKDLPTDVLSYPFGDGFPHGSGGEILICPEVVGDLARTDGRDRTEGLRETVVHGVLHVVGYTDHTDQEAREMATRTAVVLGGSDGP